MASFFQNVGRAVKKGAKDLGRAVSKGAKDTGRAVSKAARDTVDEAHRNLNRPWEAALIGGVLTPFTGGLSATAIVGGSSFAAAAGSRHVNIGQAARSAGRSTLYAGAGATVATAAGHLPTIATKVNKVGGWAWKGLAGVAATAAKELSKGWLHPQSGTMRPGDNGDDAPYGGDLGFAGGGGGGGYSPPLPLDAPVVDSAAPKTGLYLVVGAIALVVLVALFSRKAS